MKELAVVRMHYSGQSTALHKLNYCVHWSVVKLHAVLWILCGKCSYMLRNGASTFKFLESSLMASTSLRSGMVRSWGDSRVGYQPSWSRIPVWSQCHTGGEWTRPVNIVDYFYLCSQTGLRFVIKLLTDFLWSNEAGFCVQAEMADQCCVKA